MTTREDIADSIEIALLNTPNPAQARNMSGKAIEISHLRQRGERPEGAIACSLPAYLLKGNFIK
ncbi:hypothetical protein [Sulfitobacter guttiformis]|uniref:hypothetical protein n=1 Tax=Sulfitobacter guttiformis TaxID=74349 RepID=UPI000A8019CB|nr:hypothetical protein [Sulfitobacter guttiformis]KIN72351.1 hypothetical protein Z949_1524 [Sulfitobacter guttiformis KCTC 32187]